MNNSLKIYSISPSQAPYELLLLADQSKEAIDKYLTLCDVYLANIQGKDVGVCCVRMHNQYQVEIMNIAVDTQFQGREIGRELIQYVKKIARANKIRQILVGTNDNGDKQIKFYRKNGFVDFYTRVNYFKENYNELIWENGKYLDHMLVLRYEF
ncbi:GNAT family N-acetyltransferase [Myroides sp. LJL119]